jgi:hypothetical protein
MSKAEQPKPPHKVKDDPAPGKPKTAHRDAVSGGKHESKDTRRELREKH